MAERDRTLVETLLYLNQQLVKAADGLDMNMSQYHLLHFLSESPRRANDFAEVTKLRKPSIAAMVSVLETRGWIRRQVDPGDGRAQIISMTPAGRKAFRAFEDAMDRSLRGFLGEQAVLHANSVLKDFHALWNAKRVARFEAWQAGRDLQAAGTQPATRTATRGNP